MDTTNEQNTPPVEKTESPALVDIQDIKDIATDIANVIANIRAGGTLNALLAAEKVLQDISKIIADIE